MAFDWLIVNLGMVIMGYQTSISGVLQVFDIGVYLLREHVKPVYDCHLQDDNQPARQVFIFTLGVHS